MEGIHLRASPTEWVVVIRRRWLLGVCYVLMAVGLAVASFALAQLTAAQMSWFVVIAASLALTLVGLVFTSWRRWICGGWSGGGR